MKFTSRKTVISGAVIVILILVVGGFFWFWFNGDLKFRLIRWWIETVQMGGSSRDFSIINNQEGKFIENKKEGLKAKILENWEAKKAETGDFSFWGMNLFSPDLKLSEKHLLENGCIIGVNIEKSQFYFDLTNSYLQDLSAQAEDIIWKEVGYEGLEISGHKAIKELVFDNPQVGLMIEVRILLEKDKNVYLVLRSASQDKEKCLNDFNRFLEEISISK